MQCGATSSAADPPSVTSVSLKSDDIADWRKHDHWCDSDQNTPLPVVHMQTAYRQADGHLCARAAGSTYLSAHHRLCRKQSTAECFVGSRPFCYLGCLSSRLALVLTERTPTALLERPPA